MGGRKLTVYLLKIGEKIMGEKIMEEKIGREQSNAREPKNKFSKGLCERYFESKQSLERA